MLSRQPPHVPPSSPRVGEEGGQGEGEGAPVALHQFPSLFWRYHG